MSDPVSLEVRNLSKRFGSTQALSELSFEVPAASVTAFVGANGAGKTTTFSVVAGFIKPQAGDVRCNGMSMRAYRSAGGTIGLLPQDVQFYDQRSISRQLFLFSRLAGLSSSAARNEVRRVLEQTSLVDKRNARPAALSRGMKARLGIAQALIARPPILFLDEPTAGLDPRMIAEFRATIDSLRGTTTVVISSHDLSELETMCDHVVIIDKGRSIDSGPLTQVVGHGSSIRFELASAVKDLSIFSELPTGWDIQEHEEGILEVVFDPKEDTTTDVTARVLRVLLDEGLGIVSVRPAQSLERTYLEKTNV